MVLDSTSLLPISQLVSEFQVLLKSHQEDSLACLNVSIKPETQSDKDLRSRRDSLMTKRSAEERKWKAKQRSSSGIHLLWLQLTGRLIWHKWTIELKRAEDLLTWRQKKFFKGCHFVPLARSDLAKRREIMQEYSLLRLGGNILTTTQSEALIEMTHKEQQQERVLISDIDYHISSSTVTLKFASPLSEMPGKNTVTIQHLSDEVQHMKRSTNIIRFSPDNKLLALAGRDCLIYLHLVTSLGEVALKISGHTGVVQFMDWASDSLHLQTNTENHELRFWKVIKPERKAWSADEIRPKNLPESLAWSSWSCPMGWHALGIQTTEHMPPRNCIPVHSAFTHDGDFLIWGDNSHAIKLARFPCPSLDRRRKSYPGHCSPLQAVQFIDNGHRVASCSIVDCSVLQW